MTSRAIPRPVPPANDNTPQKPAPAPPRAMLAALVRQRAAEARLSFLDACAVVARAFPGLTAWGIIAIIGGPGHE